MTKPQVERLLILEGILYIAFTISITLTVGSAICYFGLSAFVSGASYMKLYFTLIPSLVCLPALMLIAIVIPVMASGIIGKSSIVERLREVD